MIFELYEKKRGKSIFKIKFGAVHKQESSDLQDGYVLDAACSNFSGQNTVLATCFMNSNAPQKIFMSDFKISCLIPLKLHFIILCEFLQKSQ